MKRAIWFLLCTAVLLCVFLSMPRPVNPEIVNLEKRTGYRFTDIQRVYAYDSIGEYRDYNQIQVYRISERESGFEKHVAGAWSPLPLDENLMNHFRLDESFDPYISDMRSCTDGYFTSVDVQSGDGAICVYDCVARLLYVRAWKG